MHFGRITLVPAELVGHALSESMPGRVIAVYRLCLKSEMHPTLSINTLVSCEWICVCVRVWVWGCRTKHILVATAETLQSFSRWVGRMLRNPEMRCTMPHGLKYTFNSSARTCLPGWVAHAKFSGGLVLENLFHAYSIERYRLLFYEHAFRTGFFIPPLSTNKLMIIVLGGTQLFEFVS